MSVSHNLRLARCIRQHGGRNSLRVVLEAERAGIPLALGCAFLTQESNFQNVFGHDNVANPVKGGVVTKGRYQEYRSYRARLGCQGVGPAQLTSAGLQDEADRLGGCWKPKHNIRVGFGFVASLQKSHKTKRAGIASYNGSGAAAQRYADSVLGLEALWASRLKGA